MAAEDCMQTIGVGADYGGHDLAYSPQGQEWNFPLFYTDEGQAATMANISIDGVVTPLTVGQQQITGYGQVVTIEWEIATPDAGVSFLSNPWNVEGLNTYPIQDVVLSGFDFNFQLGATAQPASWFLEVNVEFQPGGSAAQLVVYVDGAQISNLPPGYSSYSYTGSNIGIAVGSLVGDLMMKYNLTNVGEAGEGS